MARLRYDEYLAVALSRMHALNNPKISRLERWCFTQKNNVYAYAIAMPLKEDFVLMKAIDSVITNLMEFGLIDKWMKMSEGPSFSSLIANAKKNDPGKYIAYEESSRYTSDRTIVLTMNHIIGALVIMAFGYISALIVFVVEKNVYRRVQLRTASKLILYLHKSFSPTRNDCSTIEFSENNL